MNSPPLPPELPDPEAQLMAAARAGSPDALGQLLEVSRLYLLQVANARLAAPLQGKAGGSDLVQEALLDAQRQFPRFHGNSQTDLRAWLRGILLNKVATFTRHFGADKRLAAREITLDRSSGPVPLAASTPTPSSLFLRKEQFETLRQALERLPEHYRQVILWRQWEDLSFEEIAGRLGCGVDAGRMVWWRAIRQLQGELGDSV